MRTCMWILFLWLFVSLFTFATTPNAQEIEQILKDTVNAKRTVGIVVALIDKNGTKIYASGKTDNDGRPVDGDTVFEIGSVTKTFTATLLADMVTRGLVKLDDPVAKYLPKTAKIPARGGKEITLLDLATHRSGLPMMPDNTNPAQPLYPFADYTAEKMYAFLATYSLPRDIGARYEYSNFGAGLLGEALARRAGKSYEALLQERILRPLAMRSSGIALPPELLARQAVGHLPTLVAVKNMDFDVLAGCGALRSTVNDLCKYVAAYMGLTTSPLSSAMAVAQQDSKDTDSPYLRIGLGWHVFKFPDAVIVWHNGSTLGYHAFVGFDRKKGLGVVVLSNCKNDIDDIGMHILYPQVPVKQIAAKKEHIGIALDSKLLDAYVGDYQLTPAIILTIEKEGDKLFVKSPGDPRQQLHAEAATEFFIREEDTQVSFVKDAAGRVTHLIVHTQGQQLQAVKIK